jgi:ribosome-binding protein aMBF1 (putative translation factor)
VAVKFKKDVSVIEKWEPGEDFPAYSQLEKLAEIRQFKNETHQPQELTKKGSSGTV